MNAAEKRKSVMTRSIKLGHCVCDPRKPCPCPLFKEKNICACAGEREPLEGAASIRLTQCVRNAGCASKIGQKDLHEVLAMLPTVEDPRLLVGMATADDAGVFNLAPGVTIVQTVDVFTPGVDDPGLFGRIAACNSLSDVYAMGGVPVTALSVIGFPINKLPHAVMASIIRGGMDVLKEAGAVLLGGHSIHDEEVKFGFAVTGLVAADAVVTNAGARPGDMLVLTKPLGTGIVSLARQIGTCDPDAAQAAETSMSTLNRVAAEVMVRHGAHACTDVTGFGLIGHASRIARESGVSLRLFFDNLPLLPRVLDYAGRGIVSGANEKNAEYSGEQVVFAVDVSEAMRAVVFDAQTSGGLLIAFAPNRLAAAMADLHAQGVLDARCIGVVQDGVPGAIEVVRGPMRRDELRKELL